MTTAALQSLTDVELEQLIAAAERLLVRRSLARAARRYRAQYASTSPEQTAKPGRTDK